MRHTKPHWIYSITRPSGTLRSAGLSATSTCPALLPCCQFSRAKPLKLDEICMWPTIASPALFGLFAGTPVAMQYVIAAKFCLPSLGHVCISMLPSHSAFKSWLVRALLRQLLHTCLVIHLAHVCRQVMLTLPHAVSLTGIRAGVPLIVCYTLISMWTVHLLNALYLEYKRSKVRSPAFCPDPLPGHMYASAEVVHMCSPAVFTPTV